MRILHVFRSPVGGLFRHVRDLIRGQSAMGHKVGLICDASTGGASAQTLLDEIRPQCALGVHRETISRLPGFGDLAGAWLVSALARKTGAEMLHGHGAKGGAYARLAGRSAGIKSVYTPHGGSLHYEWRSPAGFAFLSAERMLAHLGSGFCFVCDFEKSLFTQKIGTAGKPTITVHNGLWPEEFSPVPLAPDASDFLFVGEIRHLKGIDILLHATASIDGATLTAVGDGPELEQQKQLADQLGVGSRVRFAGRMPIRDALSKGRIMVMPSRNESFPYVVLETIAAGTPLIASAAGGIPEIVPASMLVTPLDSSNLAAHMREALANLSSAKESAAKLRHSLLRDSSAEQMCSRTTAFYGTL